MELKNIFLEIALKDLQSANLLYDKKFYSQSFFLFQQASEKANKALGLSIDVISGNKDMGINHNQIKIHSKTANSQLSDVASTLEKLAKHPKITSHELFKMIDINSYKETLQNSVSYLNSIKKEDLLNHTQSDLISFQVILDELYNARVILNEKSKEEIYSNLNIYLDFIKLFGAANAQQELSKAIADENQTELISIIKTVARYQLKMIFIYYTFYLCALVTSPHYNLSRYPDEKHNPLVFYKKSNPIVKHQPIFINYLEKAIKMFQRFDAMEIRT